MMYNVHASILGLTEADLLDDAVSANFQKGYPIVEWKTGSLRDFWSLVGMKMPLYEIHMDSMHPKSVLHNIKRIHLLIL